MTIRELCPLCSEDYTCPLHSPDRRQAEPVTRYAHLWGGPEDGEDVWVGPGDLPPRIGVHRTQDGALVPIRSRALNLAMPLVADHVAVYERATVDVQRAWIDVCGPSTCVQSWVDGSLYVWRELITRWLAAQA